MTHEEASAKAPPTDRRGPIQRALATRDRDLLVSTVESRSTPDAHGCWIWNGAKGQNGYAYCGRQESRHLIHRIVGWADAGFPGELRSFPPVGHECGRRACVNPSHVAPVTSHLNTLEALVRKALVSRIHELEDAVRAFDSTHPILERAPFRGSPSRKTVDRRSVDEHPNAVLRRIKSKGDFAEKARLNRLKRFDQVVTVRRLVNSGLSLNEALEEEGLSRAVFDTWKVRLDRIMAEGERPL